MITMWLETEATPGEPPEETERRELAAEVAEAFAENGMPLSMLDGQESAYVRAWLRAMLAVKIPNDDTARDAVAPLVEDCERHPEAIVRVVL